MSQFDPLKPYDPIRAELIELQACVKTLTGFAFLAVLELGVVIYLIARPG